MNLKNTLKYIKLNETGLRMVIVFLAIILLGEIVINLSQKTSNSDQKIPSIGDEQRSAATYTVQKGESLWIIAQKLFGDGFKWKEIADLNNIKEEDTLTEGQKLAIPSPEVTKALPTPSDLNNPDNTSSTSTEAKTYTVNRGDTLWSIAESEIGSGYNWTDISQANNLRDPDSIEAGQKLYIPNVNPKSPTSSKITQTEAISGNSYTVQKGDNLWKIAVRAYGDGYKWTEISRSNKLPRPNLIYSGQSLTLPR